MNGNDATPGNVVQMFETIKIVVDPKTTTYACAICDKLAHNPEAKGECPLHGVILKYKKNL